MKKFKKTMLLSLATTLSLIFTNGVQACTMFYVGSDLTADGSTLFGRTEDLLPNHNKNFKSYPAKTNESGAKLVDPSNNFTWELPKESYQYTALPDTDKAGIFDEAGMNEHGVVMSATTTAYTSEEIQKADPFVPDGISESSITSVVLPHVKSAREGIELLGKVIAEKGSSEANGLIIADKNETWYMEIVSGHQYAAIKLPKDKFAVIANDLMIGAIDVNDKDNVIASKDLIEVAKKANSYVEEDGKIKVAQSYSRQVAPSSASRIWVGSKILNEESSLKMGQKEYPLLQDTKKKITLEDVKKLQRFRFESADVTEEGKKLMEAFETAQSTNKDDNDTTSIGNFTTMEAHIFQLKSSLPDNMPAIMWLAIGSPINSPYIPYFGQLKETAPAYQVESNESDANSYYWTIMNLTTKLLENEKEMIRPIQEKMAAFEQEMVQEANNIEKEIEKNRDDIEKIKDIVTNKSVELGNKGFEFSKELAKTAN